jgi:hypothetical protein
MVWESLGQRTYYCSLHDPCLLPPQYANLGVLTNLEDPMLMEASLSHQIDTTSEGIYHADDSPPLLSTVAHSEGNLVDAPIQFHLLDSLSHLPPSNVSLPLRTVMEEVQLESAASTDEVDMVTSQVESVCFPEVATENVIRSPP